MKTYSSKIWALKKSVHSFVVNRFHPVISLNSSSLGHSEQSNTLLVLDLCKSRTCAFIVIGGDLCWL